MRHVDQSPASSSVARLSALVQAYEPNGRPSDREATKIVERFLDSLVTDDRDLVASGLANWLEPCFLTEGDVRAALSELMTEHLFDGSTVYAYTKKALDGIRFDRSYDSGGSGSTMLGFIDAFLRDRHSDLERVIRIPGPKGARLAIVDDVWFTGTTMFNRSCELHRRISANGEWHHVTDVQLLVVRAHAPSERDRRRLESQIGRPVRVNAQRTLPRSWRLALTLEQSRDAKTDVEVEKLWTEGSDPTPFRTAGERLATTNALYRTGRRLMGAVATMNGGARARDLPLGTDARAPSFRAHGFGSPVITWRNCANNVPVALWAGPRAPFKRLNRHV